MIGVFDIEARDWNKLESIGFYDGSSFIGIDVRKTDKTSREVLEDSIEFMSHSQIDKWYAHNGGKYDFKFFLDILLDNYYIDVIYSNSSLIKIDVYDKVVGDKYKDGRYRGKNTKKSYKKFTFVDSLALLPMSLKKLTSGFDVQHKKLEYEDYEHKDREKMMEYLRYDCIGLYEVLEKFKKEMGIKRLSLTIGSQAVREYKERFDGDKYLDKLFSYPHREDIFRKAYFGGRTEVFKRYGEDLYYYDFHSMYPSVMRDKEYPRGKLIRTNRIKEDKIGIYKVRWKSPNLNIPLLPSKNKAGKLVFPIGEGEGWYYSPELKYARELGYDIDVIKGYFWTRKQMMFKDYVDYFYKIKQKSRGSKYIMSKLFLNSLYGKFGQSREVDKVIHRVPSKKETKENDIGIISMEHNLFTKPKKIYSDHIYPYISGLVTSYGRVKLHKALNKNCEVYYCDTDSLIVDSPLRTKDKLGGLGLEDKIKVGYFLYPKVYAYKNPKNEIVLKAKGFKKGEINFEDYKKAFNGDLSGFSCEWEGLIGFLEKFSRKMAGSFKEKLKKRKSLLGNFDKRKLIDNINTKPVINDVQ